MAVIKISTISGTHEITDMETIGEPVEELEDLEE